MKLKYELLLEDEELSKIMISKWNLWIQSQFFICKICLSEVLLKHIKSHSDFCYKKMSLKQNLHDKQYNIIKDSKKILESLNYLMEK